MAESRLGSTVWKLGLEYATMSYIFRHIHQNHNTYYAYTVINEHAVEASKRMYSPIIHSFLESINSMSRLLVDKYMQHKIYTHRKDHPKFKIIRILWDWGTKRIILMYELCGCKQWGHFGGIGMIRKLVMMNNMGKKVYKNNAVVIILVFV